MSQLNIFDDEAEDDGRHCFECDFADTGNGPVFYDGPEDADIVVVGQSPGAEEVTQGTPFVGPSGRLLREFLNDAGFTPKDILYCNALMCQPPKDTNIKASQIRKCRPPLKDAIVRAEPELIIALGNEAWTAVHDLDKVGGVTKNCGRVKKIGYANNCKVIWNLHPAFVLRNDNMKDTFQKILEKAFGIWTGSYQGADIPELKDEWPSDEPETLIDTLQYLQDHNGPIAIDIETASSKNTMNYQTDHILGIGFAWYDYEYIKSLYVPITHGPNCNPHFSTNIFVVIYVLLKELLEQHDALVFHAGSFDRRFLQYQYDIDCWNSFDTMIAARLLDENRSLSLKYLARTILDAPDYDITDAITKDKHLGYLPISEVGQYCRLDCAYTLALYSYFKEELDGEPYENMFYDIEMPLFNYLTQVELTGMTFNDALYEKARTIADAEYRDALEELDEASGWAGKVMPIHRDKSYCKDGTYSADARIGCRPTRQDILFILFDHFGLDEPPRYESGKKDPKYWTDSGDPSTNADTLELLRGRLNDDHEAAKFLDAVAIAKRAETMRDKSLDRLKKTVFPDGRVHTNYGFGSAKSKADAPATARLSSSNPNLQNVQKPIRPIFGPPFEGWKLLDADYSQLEVRVWCQMSEDSNLYDAIMSRDFHTTMASIALQKDFDAVTTQERNMAKILTFGGIMYGGDEAVAAREIGCSKEEARELLEAIYRRFRVGKDWLDAQVDYCYEHGHVLSLFGRKRRLPQIWSDNDSVRAHTERQAKNSPIQSGGAEVCNYALLRLMRDRLDTMQARIVNTVHDSIVIAYPPEEEEKLIAVVEDEMVKPPTDNWSVPLDIDYDIGYNWCGKLKEGDIIEEIQGDE